MEKRRAHFGCLWANYALLFLIFFLQLQNIVRCTTDGVAPIIIPFESDVTVLPGEDVKFMCQSNEPIHWRFHDEFTGNYHIYESFNQQTEYTHQSVLELIGVQYTYVGYFYCVTNSSEVNSSVKTLVKNNQASEIYLFVDDQEHPLAPVSVPLIQGNQFEEITIPCKPTSQKVDVQLIKEGDEKHQFDSIYMPTGGYRIKLNELTDGGYYTCHSSMDTSSQYDIHFHISMKLAGSKFVNKPIIRSKTDDYGVEGEQLELDCTVEAQLGADFEIVWSLPNNNDSLQEGRARIIKPEAHNHPNDGYYYAVAKLIVNNLDKLKDVGMYKCSVIDDSNIHKSATLNVINILGAQEPFIEITEPAGKYSLKVTTKIREVKWVVEYRGYPAPKLIWYDIHGDEIPWSSVEQKSCKYEAIQDKHRVTLKIRDVRVSDSGYYTLHADNGQMQKEQKFQLTVISMSKKRPIQLANTTNVSSACKSCKDLVTRLEIAEKQIRMLRLQLKEAKELNIRTRNEHFKYRDLYTNCVRGANNNL